MTTLRTALHRNPFFLLGATVRDDRQRVVTLAEERLLELDPDECVKAKSDLLNPRTRLGAEVAWLPGVSPRRAAQFVERLGVDPAPGRYEGGLPTLARANLLAALLESGGMQGSPEELARWIVELADLAAQIDPGEVLRDINEDRTVARFTLVSSDELVAQELAERGHYYRSAIRSMLDRLETRQLVAVLTRAVDDATEGGEDHAPPLIDDLVDMFEVEAQRFLEAEAQNVTSLLGAIRTAAPRGEAAVVPLVSKLEAVARNWDFVAQPIQLAMQARGTGHEMSTRVGVAIRSIGVDLFNEHQMLGQAKRITTLLQDVFAELPEFAERLDDDAEALRDIEQSRNQAGGRRAEWEREISYRAEIGMVLKDVLSISPEGVSWRGRNYPLESVTRVRWGAVRHSVNGIPTGTTYTIAFGDASSEAVVECRREEVFDAFIPRLWKAVGIRILLEALQTLREGREWRVGGITVRDDAITLTRHNFWTKEPAVRPWDAIKMWSADGSLNIAAKDDQKVSASLSYIHDENAHVLEHMLQMAFRRAGLRRLSELLK